MNPYGNFQAWRSFVLGVSRIYMLIKKHSKLVYLCLGTNGVGYS